MNEYCSHVGVNLLRRLAAAEMFSSLEDEGLQMLGFIFHQQLLPFWFCSGFYVTESKDSFELHRQDTETHKSLSHASQDPR